MSHLIYEGEVYHKRFFPKKHAFTYPFFLLDIDPLSLKTLNSNLLTFSAKDHFGESEDFLQNIDELLKEFGLEKPATMRFLTLPRMMNYVFNPISVLVLFDTNNKPTDMLVEVHNYNGGRIVYPVTLQEESKQRYSGSVFKDMYVSPFLKRDGLYKFVMEYTKEQFNLSITLYEENAKMLVARLSTKAKSFSKASARSIFLRHLFLTFRVVTRTLWQSLLLYIKGVKFYSVTPQDQTRRY